jgi:hypothetical protein
VPSCPRWRRRDVAGPACNDEILVANGIVDDAKFECPEERPAATVGPAPLLHRESGLPMCEYSQNVKEKTVTARIDGALLCEYHRFLNDIDYKVNETHSMHESS